MKSITAAELKKELEGGGAILVDVRQAAEYRYEHAPRSKNFPISELKKSAGQLPKDKKICVMCQAGISSASAVRTLEAEGFERVFNVGGGLEAWKAARYPVERTQGAGCVIPIMRQVQIIAGSMVLIGSLITGMKWLAILAGAGLLFAGLSGTCMMASALARMPWNRA